MKTEPRKRNGKKAAVLAALALLLVACVAMGTMAWLTATDELTNTFTVGEFKEPDTDDDTTTPDKDPSAPDVATPNVSGYMIEPSWDTTAEHKLVPGGSLYKDPYVGIGKGSEDAVVYVYVDNPFKDNSVYFQLNTTNWQPVTGHVAPANGEITDGTSTVTNAYTGGLFKYTPGLTASDSQDVWTTKPVFTKVNVNENAVAEDFAIGDDGSGAKEITVKCFIHQAKDGDGQAIEAATIEAAAIAALVPTGNP